MIFLFWSCISFHQIGQLEDFSSDTEKNRNAHRAAKYSQQNFWLYPSEKQALSLQVLGLLRSTESEALNATLAAIKHPVPSVRYQAIWSLGEISRELDWNTESKKIHDALLHRLEQAPQQRETQLILEAITKNYCQHPHSEEEAVYTLKKIHSFMSTIAEPPDILLLLLSQVETLSILTTVLEENIQEGNSDAIYSSSLQLLRYLKAHQQEIYDGFLLYQDALQDSFSMLGHSLDRTPSRTQSMILWFLSETASKPPLSSLIIDRLIEIESSLSTIEHFILEQTLYSMLEEEASRQYFRQHLLSHQRSSAELQWWHDRNSSKLDIIQQNFGISLGTAP